MKLLVLLAMVAAPIVVAAPAHHVQPRDSRHDGNLPGIGDKKFIDTVMNAHWYWRRIHCAQDLTWDPALAQAAADSVNVCTNKLQHDRGGSNLSGVGPSPDSYDEWIEFARTAIHGWHEEEPKYPYGTPPQWNDAWGHFTQMVWRDSSRIGCALSNCNDFTHNWPGRIYCFYERAGNNIAPGQFAQNVWPPVCKDPSKAEAAQQFAQ